MDFPPYVSVAVIVGMVLLGLSPKGPVWLKIFLQIIVGAVIYFEFGEATFNLPFAEESPLYGGAIPYKTVNLYSVGFLSALMGIVCSLVFLALSKLMGKSMRTDE